MLTGAELTQALLNNSNRDVENLSGYHTIHTLPKKATMHQVTTMLATSKNVLIPGHNHLLTTGTDDPTLWLSPKREQVW